MRNKTRFDFVDEFRKINTLQKLLPIQNLYTDDLDEGKQQNNKFIRYRQEMTLQQRLRSDDILCKNEIVSKYKVDIEPECNQNFNKNLDDITQVIDYYKDWSETLNQQIKQRQYKHKFKYRDAIPPPRLKEEAIIVNPKINTIGKEDDPATEKNNEQDANIELPHRGKYNFHEITKQYFNNSNSKEDKDNNFTRDLTIKNEISQLRELKNLQQIQKIGDFYEEFEKFNYYVELPTEQSEIQFIDNSIIRGNNNLAIDYFRDMGTPSRNLAQYTLQNYTKMNVKDDEENQLDIEYNLEKRQTLYLYLLKEDQLKINKHEMTFFDMANLAMGRITSNNSQMCIRNQKVTKTQYLKLLGKMQKYDLRENEAGKSKQNKQVGTEDLQDLNIQAKGDQISNASQDNTNIQKVIEQINEIRREVKLFQDKDSTNHFNRNNFNNQIYIKLQSLLNVLFQMVIDKLPVKYTIHQIRDHLSEIQGKNQLGYDRLRVLWFVSNCYEQMINKQQKKVDLRNMVNHRGKNTPQLIKYKGTKVTATETIQPKKVYGFNQKTPTRDVSRTPTKTRLNTSAINRTPTKGTNSKINSSGVNTTAKKYPYTAKK